MQIKLGYRPVPYNEHGLPKTRELSMETAMTITMWAVIVEVLVLLATLTLVSYNAFQLSKPDDITCTLDEYSELQWVVVPTSIAKQLPNTLLYKESADSAVTKGTATIPETQKMTCAEKIHHGSPENAELNQQRRRLSTHIEPCDTLITKTLNFTTMPIAKIIDDRHYPVNTSFETTYEGAIELSFPNNTDVCTIPKSLSVKDTSTFIYYSMDSENDDGLSKTSTNDEQFSIATPYLGFFNHDNTLAAYIKTTSSTTNDASLIWSVSDNLDNIYLFTNTEVGDFQPKPYPYSYNMPGNVSTNSEVIAWTSNVDSVNNTVFTTIRQARYAVWVVVHSITDHSYVVFS
jgi:hypothetical protein